MYVANAVMIAIFLILITVIGLRALVTSDDESGQFAGAALLAMVVTISALLVSSR